MEHRDTDQNWSRNGAGKERARAAIYARVSTSEQNPELQLREIHDYASRQGWEIVETYQDTISGAKVSRPGLNGLMADARARKFTCLLVWKLDRFGRSLVDCLNNIRFLEDHGIRFVAVTQGLDTDIQNPASRFLLHVLGAAAEFERSLIRERTQAGRLRYQQDYDAGKVGKTVYSRSGKNLPVGRPKRIFNRERVIDMRQGGASIRQIAKQLGVGVATVVRVIRDPST
jgi:DNA invertase Pin-like site-specific DNA recombinase